MSDHKFLTETVPPVVHSPAVETPIDDLTIKEQLEAWITLDVIEKSISKRKEALRDSLLKHVSGKGEFDENGHQTVELDGTKVKREKRVAKLPEMKDLEVLCTKLKVAKEKLPFDIVETRVINVSKLESLVSLGKLTEDQVQALCKVTYALQVEQSEEIKALVKAIREGDAIEVTEVVAAPKAKAG